MANLKEVEEQLKRLGCNFRFWGRWEVKELANVLLPGETIEHCVNGIYEGGFAMLAATDQRMILIDKKPMYLTLEDIRFDMVSELDYNHRLLNSSLKVCTPNQTLRFKSYNGDRLRQLFNFVQRRVMEIRHYFMEHQNLQTTPQPQPQTAPDLVAAQPLVQLPSEQLQPPQPQQIFSQPVQPEQTPGNFSTAVTTAATQTVPQFQQTSDSQSQGQVDPRHIGIAGMKKVVPVISAYTRLPLLSRQRGYSASTRGY